jgi:curved DNA-binding protein CbpA
MLRPDAGVGRISSRDPKGYYFALGVGPSASTAEIKAAYRRRAKILHPDRNPGPDASTKFQKLSEAFRVLRDPRTRADYCRAPSVTHALDIQPPEVSIPVACSRCGKMTAQPRYIVFRYIVGLLVSIRRAAYQGIYCARCARLTSLRASLISGLAGWWAIPQGPICSVAEIVRNAFGGYEPPGSREKLLWQNATAFAARGNGELAYAIARDLRSARNEQMARRAAGLMNELKAHGVSARATDLKSAWSRSPADVALHFCIALILPALLVGAAMWIWRQAS